MHLIPPPSNLDEDAKLMLDRAKSKIEERYARITDAISEGNFEQAMGITWDTALVQYLMNQDYTSDFLEISLLLLNDLLSKNKTKSFKCKKNTILYYDLPALNDNSLTPIFLDALGAVGLNIVYVILDDKIGEVPKIMEVLKKYGGEVKTVSMKNSYVNFYNELCDVIVKVRPEYMLSYPYPQDVVGCLAFMRFKGSAKRYLMDIADHTFWIGRNSFDYFAVGRNVQASIAALYRGIEKDKLVEFHYAPVIPKTEEFQGFPFEKNKDDFIIFSGGASYKTNDNNLTFYNIIANVLSTHENVKFWYAVKNETEGMQKLTESFPERVFNTESRSDLPSVLENVDMYLNTYPMYGGSMMTLAAEAGVPPFTLKFGDEVSGLLKDQESLGIIFDTPKELFEAIHKYIVDPKYRNELKQNMKRSIYTRDEMIEYVREMIYNPTPYKFDVKEPNTRDFMDWRFMASLNTVKHFLGGF